MDPVPAGEQTRAARKGVLPWLVITIVTCNCAAIGSFVFRTTIASGSSALPWYIAFIASGASQFTLLTAWCLLGSRPITRREAIAAGIVGVLLGAMLTGIIVETVSISNKCGCDTIYVGPFGSIAIPGDLERIAVVVACLLIDLVAGTSVLLSSKQRRNRAP